VHEQPEHALNIESNSRTGHKSREEMWWSVKILRLPLRMSWMLVALAFLEFLFRPMAVHGQALRFQPQGARAVGQGNAFAAQADDPSAIHYNPAGLTQVQGVQSVLGINLVGGSVQFKSPTGVESRGDLNGSVSWPPPSNFYPVSYTHLTLPTKA
jgi:long-subunit fatty acid transport protein